MPHPGLSTRIHRRLHVALIATLCFAAALLASSPAGALLSIDFEQAFYVHEGWQVWDFCLVEHEGLYRIYYLAVPESDPVPLESDNIWMASSEDLSHWSEPESVLSVSDSPWEQGAVWAPDVVFDEASGKWWMAYTAVDLIYSQRICMAWSTDLVNWTKSQQNPSVEPTMEPFYYDPAAGWAECRDPFLYRQDGQWNLLASVKINGMPDGQGAVLHVTSNDMEQWTDHSVLLRNTGETPVNALESVQYHEITRGHHLFFHEYSTQGVTWLGSVTEGAWNFEDRATIDLGIAPEVDSFDGGESWLLSRAAPYQNPNNPVVSVVTRIDTMQFRQGAVAPTVFRADPWLRDFASYGGSMCLGNPCFGDNPAVRGEEPAGTVGWGYLGTREYFRGPLSNRGAAGIQLGATATGFLRGHDFVVEGTAISFLIGGSNQPDLCYLALMDATADTMLRHATGDDHETMVQQWWDVSNLQGRSVYIYIEDMSYDDYLNVDEIHETMDDLTAAPEPLAAAPGLRDQGAWPNPFNPLTVLHFGLDRPTTVEAVVYDLRGRRVWTSGRFDGDAGDNSVTWAGVDGAGRSVPGGLYVYRLTTAHGETVSGKLTLIP